MWNINLIFRMTVTVLVAGWFLIAPIDSLIAKGPFDWHTKQPEAWQGGGEVLALMLLVYGALSLPWKRLRIGLVVLFAWLYARHHGVDLAILILYLYAESLFALGWFLLPRIGVARVPRPAHLLLAGFVGVVAWSLVIWISSALGYGSLNAIHVIAGCFLGLSLFLIRGPRVAFLLSRAIQQRKGMDRILVALLVGFFFALFAKASVVMDSDSVWYGLQADRFLVGEGNLYSGQGLVALVHYYPKLYEALQLPLAGLGSVPALLGLGVFSWLMTVLTTPAILREFNVRPPVRMMAAALVATVPALANSAVSAKGDVFAAWLMMIALLGTIRFRKGKGGVWFWVALCAIAVAVLARLSTLPYAGILSIILLFSAIKHGPFDRRVPGLMNPGLYLFGATTVLVCLVMARTLLLAGVPLVTPDFLVAWAGQLGFDLKYPIGRIPTEIPVRIPLFAGLWSYLFAPAQYILLMITWTGNVWAFLPIAVILLDGLRRKNGLSAAWPVLALGLTFFVVLFGFKFRPDGYGADGNYFIFPIICLTIWGAILTRELRGPSARLVWIAALFFSLSSAAISFVTGSWGPGTRAFDLAFDRSPFDYAPRRSQAITAARLNGVERFLKRVPSSTRVVGFENVSPDQVTPAGFWLPVRYEPIYIVAYSLAEAVRSGDNFASFLQRVRIEYVIIPDPIPGGSKLIPSDNAVIVGLHLLGKRGLAKVVYQDTHWALWKLTQVYSVSGALAGGSAQIHIREDELCTGDKVAEAVVNWSAPEYPSVAIEVKSEASPSSSLWTEASNSGSATTGDWISPGVEFIFRGGGRGGKVIGTIKIAPECKR